MDSSSNLPNVDWYARPRRAGENNGFAPGDRIQVVGGPDTGKLGWVTYSSGGCESDWCRAGCRLVYVRFGSEGQHRSTAWTHGSPRVGFTYDSQYLVADVAHVD